MTRNLYLGADVGPAMDLLPNFAAAAEFMWEQLKRTDFPSRAGALAAEAASARPDVIALQEATTWLCTPHIWQLPVPVYDFTSILTAATQRAGVPYRVAKVGTSRAFNTGFAINPIAGLTMVNDPAVFQPLFGQDDAACGFQIADALLVRDDLAPMVRAAGTSEFAADYTIIPTVMNVYRGYAWADIEIHEVPIRFVATHLESLFDPVGIPVARQQAAQLNADLKGSTMPTVVMGDFNSDPRDPRPVGQPNPGQQPTANEVCPAQSVDGGDDTCSAYWLMVNNGWRDSGPSGPTWGFTALLNGNDPQRPAGLTDRLDYVFSRGMGDVAAAALVGQNYPDGPDMALCAGQVVCAPSDHAGVVVEMALPAAGDWAAPPPAHSRIPFGFWKSVFLAMGLLLVWRVRVRIRRVQAG
jgi:endonuclease/exonuclease/phosphatase family metal-dependent hydrolase